MPVLGFCRKVDFHVKTRIEEQLYTFILFIVLFVTLDAELVC